eukprot:TRINITY_DN361_c0_g1_i1.p1 TRINITY_DN361_c0_g1~~TRINITY_DN361_c0_g1_i1.p1  ORF type:complete len:103 (+),score=18.18 TRINITY_DN361_c0_g1_i1:150-458(+)
MTEVCQVKASVDKQCQNSCKQWWAEYEACGKRISTFDQLSEKKLVELSDHHHIKTTGKDHKTFSKEILVENLKAQAQCNGQYIDYFRCVDQCSAPKLFAKLK